MNWVIKTKIVRFNQSLGVIPTLNNVGKFKKIQEELGIRMNKYKIRNEHVRGSVKVTPVTKKITEKRLKWYYGRYQKGKKTHAMRNVRCTSTRKETERKTENQVEILL